MNKNSTLNVPPPVIIRQVTNGFIVEGVPSEYCGISREEARVFQSFAELERFIASHFTHRSSLLESDTKKTSSR